MAASASPSGAPRGSGPVPSPCTDVCRIDEASGWCLGCRRTLDEIAAWSTLDDEGKRRVWALLPARRARMRDDATGREGGSP